MSKEFLYADNLTKIYRQGFNRVAAVNKARLRIEKGERVFIHGPSGAGKSTLLNMLGALSRPTKGEVIFKGKDLYRMSDRQRSRVRNRSFGFIFQFYYLLPELTVLENVMLPAIISGNASREKVKIRAMDILDRVKMSHRLKFPPSRLSGGESQRAAIARALINAPDILFCDEPTGNLDSEMSRAIYRLLLDLSKDKAMSVVIVSHQDVMEQFFNSEYVMTDGELSGASHGPGPSGKGDTGGDRNYAPGLARGN